MPRARPPYIEQQITRHGRKVWYFRRSRNEPRLRLPDAYGSEAFMAAYRACLAGEQLAVPGRRRAARGAVKWLVDLYHASAAWGELKPATRRARDGVLNHLVAKVGDGDVEDLTREEIELNMATKTVSMANLTLQALRTMFAWAIEAKHVEDNPTVGIRERKRIKANPDAEDGHKTWSKEEQLKFEAAYPLGTLERLVYTQILFTGLRIGDTSRLGRQHVQADGTFAIRTEKTGKPVYAPILPPLREALAAGPHGRPDQLTFITGKRGRAVGKAHLGAWFNQRARDAGLVKCTCHGLRKAAATRCAEAGATVKQMMALFGWKRPDMAIKYCQAAEDKVLATEAAQGLLRDKTGNVYSLTPFLGEGARAENGAISVA